MVGVFGAPSRVLPSGEIFWGQDRLELLERALNGAGRFARVLILSSSAKVEDPGRRGFSAYHDRLWNYWVARSSAGR